MKLTEAKKGQKIEICSIPDENARVQAIRFGIAEGSLAICCEKIPFGPVILSRGMQEIAIGRKLADKITIKALNQ